MVKNIIKIIHLKQKLKTHKKLMKRVVLLKLTFIIYLKVVRMMNEDYMNLFGNEQFHLKWLK